MNKNCGWKGFAYCSFELERLVGSIFPATADNACTALFQIALKTRTHSNGTHTTMSTPAFTTPRCEGEELCVKRNATSGAA